ncbi:DUF6878 family protein [Asaia bogorensis]|uniref:DUF6878 domain-containing protein n=1 Tax=Asaia bogorensis NBRC 16594 TaxID=1231624 RepID=A0AAN4R5N4_9PROT|nr:DUF6878 family protein [Asaia bogorensis]GBQ81232.1 hypothetical protein AA0311_2569 [Asaia bogorensis NBRC 16594]GEL54922.1 hypothetical protein ABO01nite_29290 [Asaia bogorensis NBRC 16594]
MPSEYAGYEARERSAFAQNRETLFTALAIQGCQRVTVDYGGSSDSGGIEDIRIEPDTASLEREVSILEAQWNKETLAKRTAPLKEVLEATAMHLVCREHDGWENCCGGGGEVTWDVAGKSISVEHYDYIEHREYSSHTY